MNCWVRTCYITIQSSHPHSERNLEKSQPCNNPLMPLNLDAAAACSRRTLAPTCSSIKSCYIVIECYIRFFFLSISLYFTSWQRQNSSLWSSLPTVADLISSLGQSSQSSPCVLIVVVSVLYLSLLSLTLFSPSPPPGATETRRRRTAG